jgi:hypothetical protein
MIIKQYLDSLKQTDETINNLFAVKTLLQESIIKESHEHLFRWRNKKDHNIIALVVGINYQTKNVTINAGNYRGITLAYSEFMDIYELEKW